MIGWVHVRDGLTAAIADANRSGRPAMITVQKLHIEQVVVRDAVVVTVTGDVDLSTVSLLTNGMTAAHPVSRSPRTLVVDLSAVTFFGAAGLTSLVIADHHCREQGITLQIVADQRAILRPLEITGLIETLPVVPTLRPQWARRRRTIRATRAILDATAAWVIQAARNLIMDLEDAQCRAQFLIRSRDGTFPHLFDAILADADIQDILSGIQMPRMSLFHPAVVS